MQGLEWAFKLRDQVTQPAGSISSQLGRVTFALKALDVAAKQARLEKMVDPLKKTRLELQIHRDKLLLSKRAIEDHSHATTSASRSWTDSLLKWAGSLYILDHVARAFRAVGRAALAMSDQVKDAIETRQRGLFGLRATMGAQAGAGFEQQLQAQAKTYGRPPGGIVGMGASFAQMGADPDTARALVAAVEDVRARTGGRVDIAEQIRSILTSPVVGVGNVDAFSGAMPRKDLWAALGKQMGMRPGDAEQMLKLNQVRGGMEGPMIPALLNAVAGLPNQGGVLGTSAKGFADKTIEGSSGRVKTAWEQLLSSLENSQGVKTLQAVLQNLATTLGGKKVQGALTSLADTMGKALEPLTGPEGKQRMEAFFTSLAELLKQTIPLLAIAAKWTDIVVRYSTGQRAPGAPKSITEEVDQFSQWLAKKLYDGPLSMTPQTAGAAVLSSLPGSRAMDSFNRGLAGAETPGRTRAAQVTVNVGGVSMKFDGVTKEDAHALTKAFTDQLSTALGDALEQAGIEQGSQ